MKRKNILATGIAVAFAAMTLAPQATAADLERGALLTTSCFSCHSIDATGNMPNLVGYPRDVMISQMQAFKDGTRPATIMDRLAKGYSEEEIVQIADHFSSVE